MQISTSTNIILRHRITLHSSCAITSRDLNERLTAIAGPDNPLLLECLAFAEGRLLSIHPFIDFNGRATRLFLAELLRRLDLPSVELAPVEVSKRAEYLKAIRAADKFDWKPLIELWRERLENG